MFSIEATTESDLVKRYIAAYPPICSILNDPGGRQYALPRICVLGILALSCTDCQGGRYLRGIDWWFVPFPCRYTRAEKLRSSQGDAE